MNHGVVHSSWANRVDNHLDETFLHGASEPNSHASLDEVSSHSRIMRDLLYLDFTHTKIEGLDARNDALKLNFKAWAISCCLIQEV